MWIRVKCLDEVGSKGMDRNGKVGGNLIEKDT